ncbi:MAG: hypothetical protein KME10_24230 [Plectolyngbya sp. WJT66-NPBG17]|nr:hypothetical protein [Plectolyngbya sp. WJT66-NPBG17]
MARATQLSRQIDYIRVVVIALLIGVLVGGAFSYDFIMGLFMALPRKQDGLRWWLIEEFSILHFAFKWMFALAVIRIGWQIQDHYNTVQNLRFTHRLVFYEVRDFVIAPIADPRRDFLWAFLFTVASWTLPYVAGCLALLPFYGLSSVFFGEGSSVSSSWFAGGLFLWMLVVNLFEWTQWVGGLAAYPLFALLMIPLAFFQGDANSFEFLVIGAFLTIVFFAGVILTEMFLPLVFMNSSQLEEELRNAPLYVPFLLRLRERNRRNR